MTHPPYHKKHKLKEQLIVLHGTGRIIAGHKVENGSFENKGQFTSYFWL